MDVASRGGARGRPRDAPVALELDERPLVPVHLQQHRVPDSHLGRGLDPRERRWRWRARKSAQFRHVRRRIGGGIGTRARAGGGGLVFRGRRGRRGRGTADGARRTNDFLTRSLSPRQRQQQRSADGTRRVSFCRAFQKPRAPPVPSLDVRASSRRDEPPAVRPLRPHPRRERARDRAARRRARTRKRGRAVSKGGGGGG